MHARRGSIEAAEAGSLAAEPILDLIDALDAAEAEAAASLARHEDPDAGRRALVARRLEAPAIPLDNGVAGRIIRGGAPGRDVYPGARSEAGTRVGALVSSLPESCRPEGVDGQADLPGSRRG